MLLPAAIISVQWEQTHVRRHRSQTCSALESTVNVPPLPAAEHTLGLDASVISCLQQQSCTFQTSEFPSWSLSSGIRILSMPSNHNFVSFFSKCVFKRHSTHTPTTVEQQHLHWRLKSTLSHI